MRLSAPFFALLLALAACSPAAPVAQTAPERPAAPRPMPTTAAIATSPAAASSMGALRSGPMLADVTHRTARVWLQTSRPAEVRLDVVALATDDPDVIFRPVVMPTETIATTSEGDHIATFALSGLEPGWTYGYTVVIDGEEVARPYPTEIRTQPLWQWRTDPPALTIALGSCFYDNDPAYDRPGDGYGGDTAIFEAIRAQEPGLMLWLGDNTYFREVDWWSPEGLAYRHARARETADLQPLLASTAHAATWDDHDYGPNDSDRSYVLKQHALDAFQRYWPRTTSGMPGVPGVFTQFQWGDVEIFLLDDRWHRAPNRGPEETIFGDAQLSWLMDALTASRAPFKIIASGGQILNPVQVFENVSREAPAERERILREIHERRINGVVFLSGDRHHGELIRIDREDAYPLVEFTSSPLTAGASTYATREDSPELNNPARVEGTLIAGVRNFGILEITGPHTDRTMTMRAHDAEGALLWEHAVRARDLEYPRERN